ncbi:MAG: nuclear transport factor 2 family protein [Chloroflexi bacterium]|nr:nuclear transport factor 2 family protein [Chloroflexota bacterium]
MGAGRNALAVARRYLAALAARDWEGLGTLLSEDAGLYDCRRPQRPVLGAAAVVGYWRDLTTRLPDLAIEERAALCCGDEVVLEVALQATFPGLGTLWVSGCDVVQTKNGHIANIRAYWDGTLFRAVGLLPPAEGEDWRRPTLRPCLSGSSREGRAIAAVREYLAACNAHDKAWVARCHIPNAVSVFNDMPSQALRGAAAIASFWDIVFSKRPDCSWTEDHSVAQGGQVALEWSLYATYPGLGPIWVCGVDCYVVRGGRIAQARQYWDGSVARVGRTPRPQERAGPMVWPV